MSKIKVTADLVSEKGLLLKDDAYSESPHGRRSKRVGPLLS
jgi:hypothetical protein